MEIEKAAIENYVNAIKELHCLGILKSKHDFTSQIGEWLVEALYDGKRADSSIQKGWDINVKGYHIQVKAHAKAKGNNNRWSIVDRNLNDKIDELIIIEFSEYYKILKFYKVPWSMALPHIKKRNKKAPRFELSWCNIEAFKVNLEELPKQEVVSIFR
jgi:hypothetical protein